LFQETIGCQTGQCIVESIIYASVPGMPQVKNVFQQVDDGLDHGSFFEQKFIFHLDEFVFHVLSDFGQQCQALLIKVFKELLEDIPCIAKDLSF
jgi:hypothetical protein